MFMMNKLTPAQRVQKATIDVMAKDRYAALAGVLMIGRKTVETDAAKCPTAYTNGKDVIFGADFIEGLNDAELRFLLLHEEYHKLYRHLVTWKWMWDENPQLANMACDYVINVKIVDDNKDGFATMTGELKKGCFDEKYRGWDAAQVFHHLKKNPPPQGGGKGGQGQGGESFDEHGWEEAEDMTADDKNTLAREIDEAIRQGALMAGKTGTGGNRDFDDLLQPQVDWRDVLREFVQTTCTGSDYSTWKKPNRRYIGANIYLPSGITESVGELAILIDTSGSTFAPGVLPAFMSEAKAICDTVKPSRVHIIYWDTSVCQAEVYERDELEGMIASTQPKGGGGTQVQCAIDYMQKNNIAPQASIVLTDGYLGGAWGNWSCPVLWCVIDNKNASPNCGTTVHINTQDM
jgi:predicted metal-dependent peptidase